MPRPIRIDDLPSAPVAARFEGRDHGARVSLFGARFEPGGGPGPHRHPYEETFVVQEGSVTFTLDGETLEAHAGEIVTFSLPPGHAELDAAGRGGLK